MKKAVLTSAVVLSLSLISIFSAPGVAEARGRHHHYSHDSDDAWSTVGKILTGVVGAGVVREVFDDRDYYRPSRSYYYYEHPRKYRRHCRRYRRPDVVVIDDRSRCGSSYYYREYVGY